jgi:hypothetical protein
MTDQSGAQVDAFDELTAGLTARWNRLPAVLGDYGPAVESVDPAVLKSLPADEVRRLFDSAEFVIVRMPGGYLSLECADSLVDDTGPDAARWIPEP